MKNDYHSPDLSLVRLSLSDVLSGSPTDTVPIQDGGEEPGPDAPELPDDL